MLKSILSMILVRGLTLIFPLVLIPLQIKLLGINQYGYYNVLLAYGSIAAVFLNFGFDYTVSRNIARVYENIRMVSHYYSVALISKFLLFIGVSTVLLLIFFYKGQLRDSFGILIFCLSQVIMPVYLFQGLRRMGYLVYNTVFSNLAFCLFLCYLVFIQRQATSVYLYTAYSLINFISSLLMIYIIHKKLDIKFVKVCFKDVWVQLRDGVWIFFSRIMSMGLSQLSIILLSGLLNPTLLGVYSLADKLVRAANSIFYAFQQATYPYFCSNAPRKNFIRLTLALVIMASLGVVILYFSESLVIYFFPELKSSFMIVILMFTALIPMALSGMIGVNFLLAQDHNRAFAICLCVGAVWNILMLKFYVTPNSIKDAAFTLVSTEIVVVVAMLVSVSFITRIKDAKRI
ncbi:oligosaccharide flippase family protein [Cronobacter dublinensis]